ncbi:hypothetical protein AMTRI_Chr08g165610 [Amborella trichopoda]
MLGNARMTRNVFLAFAAVSLLVQCAQTRSLAHNSKGNCSYWVEIETTCAPQADTASIVGVRFGDNNGNHVVTRHLKNPKLVYDPKLGQRKQGAVYKGFDRCAIDMFEVQGSCMERAVCYLYLRRMGPDGWRPGWVKVLHNHGLGGADLSPVSGTFYFRTFLPENVWFGFDYCESNQPHLPQEAKDGD